MNNQYVRTYYGVSSIITWLFALTTYGCGVASEGTSEGYQDAAADVSPPTDASTNTYAADASDADASEPPFEPGGPDPVECAVAPCVTSLTAAAATVCALLSDGTVRCWGGTNSRGELGSAVPPAKAPYATPVAIVGIDQVTQISAGAQLNSSVGSPAVCARRTSGEIRCWGDNDFGQLGFQSDAGAREDAKVDAVGQHVPVDAHPTPTRVPGLPAAARVDVGAVSACAITDDGDAFCWGSNDSERLLRHTSAPLLPPGQADFEGRKVQSIETGSSTTYDEARFALRTTHALESWGEGPTLARVVSGDDDAGFDPRPMVIPGLDAVSVISSSSDIACAVERGQALCWGSNASGSLGTGSLDPFTRSTPLPIRLPPGSDAKEVSVHGSNYGCARLADGRVYCWGRNDRGELGNGNIDDQPTPDLVQGLRSPAVQIVTTTFLSQATWPPFNASTTCALLRDGSVQCWGDNTMGQLGLGSVDADPHPIATTVKF